MRPEIVGELARASAKRLQLTLSETLAIAATGPKRYRSYTIGKRNGDRRTICQPSKELKALQYVLIRNLLKDLPIHAAATAYVAGGSIKDNATRHAAGRVLYKLDFRGFFPSIRAGDWAAYALKNLPNLSRQDIGFMQHVLFWGNGTKIPDCLSIGAPSSPFLSNILMFDFDEHVTKACADISITYSRYADDLTFSSKGHLDQAEVRTIVRAGIARGYIPRLTLNEQKTVLVSNATQRRVTGLIITNEGAISLGRDRKRSLSSMVDHFIKGDLSSVDDGKLRGWLAYALDVEPDFIDRLKVKYGEAVIQKVLRGTELD